MKRTALMVIILMIALLTCLSAFADHSVLPSAGDLNETQALDIMVSFLCQQMNCSEDEIRGRFHYMATYYPKSSWVNDYRGSLWGVCINSPEPREDVSYAKADINAQTGEIIEFLLSDEWDWTGYEEGLDRLPLIPAKDQMQPHEAIDRARAILAETVGSDHAEEWQDYHLAAVTDQGRFWYLIILGRDNIEAKWPLTLTVWIDADTGEVIWHSDTERLAFRYEIYRNTGSWTAWYSEQIAGRVAEWGPSYTWDYRQHAAFEEACGGIIYWPERLYGLPGDADTSFDAACDAAAAWVSETEDPAGEWCMIGSWFHDDENGWINWIDCEYAGGIPPEDTRYWEIGFESSQPSLTRFGVKVDCVTGEVIGKIVW
ncbi:MAG: hypothetical protein IKP40_10225 [Clostridia bacterium]|nr:hypothetical protein [Clostridia bacterium]